jgi:hypothetical protein
MFCFTGESAKFIRFDCLENKQKFIEARPKEGKKEKCLLFR